MNETSDDRPERYSLNAEDLEWKTHFFWDGIRWAVADYRKYKSVGEYKDAVDATGLRYGISCAWPLNKFMLENHLTFPEAYELLTQGYEEAAARRGLYRTEDGKVIRKRGGSAPNIRIGSD